MLEIYVVVGRPNLYSFWYDEIRKLNELNFGSGNKNLSSFIDSIKMDEPFLSAHIVHFTAGDYTE